MTEKYKFHPQQTGELQNVSTGGIQTRSFGGGVDHLQFSLPGRHNFFKVSHESYEGGGVDGTVNDLVLSNWPSQWVFENWNPIKTNNGSNDVPNVGWLSTLLFARSRPDSKSFDISRFIGELKDLPGMIKRMGEDFLSKGIPYSAGHLTLSYKFGWAPFFDDIAKMTLLQTLIDKRFKQLKSLKENGSEIRKVKLYSGTKEYNASGVPMEDWVMSINNVLTDTCWGYTIWNTTNSYPSTDQDLMDYARKTALNLDPLNGQTAWQLIPWSWLSDWFLNVGTYLEAIRNSDEFTCSVAMLCHQTDFFALARSTGFREGTSYPGLTLRPYVYKSTLKTRFAADPPTITAHIPVLNAGHMGILSSIAATKYRP
ncbi:MAG: hypothetical protein [Grapevine-associated levi-like virus 1]|uniref:Uncharacterized protein n=1 Tax=Grapevine-associated levi-like virus 1 TaxID=2814354 RepID=A0A8F5RCT6_9VIRU|nr:MAG: hypothetical protein [Grapevine-associated levi-like virus 1]